MAHRLIARRTSSLSESRLRKIIQEELERKYLIEEGLWDDVKAGAKKLSDYVTKQFKAVAEKWASTITDKLSKLNEMPEEIKRLVNVLKQAMKESGESITLDEGLQAAKDLSAMNKEKALSVVESDLEGPVKEKAQSMQVAKAEGRQLASLYAILSEHAPAQPLERENINESLGVTTVLGVGLAVMGGLPMLFKGLYKLANALGAKSAAKMFDRAERATYHFEHTVVDKVMPDKLAYKVYTGLWSIGIKLTKGKKPLNEFEIKVDDEGIKALKHAKGLIYKAMLVYFAWNGLVGVLHAGASLLGFVEGGATAVKGVELARGAEEIAKIVIASRVSTVAATV